MFLDSELNSFSHLRVQSPLKFGLQWWEVPIVMDFEVWQGGLSWSWELVWMEK